MATQTVEFPALPGRALTAKARPANSATIAATVACTEFFTGVYRVAFTDLPARDYILEIVDDVTALTVAIVGSGGTVLTLGAATAVYRESEPLAAVVPAFALPKPIAEYTFTETSGTVLTDVSGNGNHGTLTGSPTLEGWGITTAASKYCDGAAATSAARTVLFAYIPGPSPAVGRVLSGVTEAPLYQRFAPTTDTPTDLPYPDTVSPFLTAGLTTSASYINATDYPAIAAVVLSATTQICIDGRHPASPLSVTDASATTWSGGVRFGGHWVAAACEVNTYCYAMLFAEQLTEAQVTIATAYIRSKLSTRMIPALARANSPAVKTTNLWGMVGNSLTVGLTFSSITPTGSWDRRQLARGSIAFSVIKSFALDGLAPLYRPLASKNVAIVWIGIEACYEYTRDTCLQLRQRGWRTVCMSSISHTGDDVNMASVNASLLANYTTFADAYANLAADGSAGPALCTAGSSANATYFSDGIHLTSAGNALIYPVLTAAINTAAA